MKCIVSAIVAAATALAKGEVKTEELNEVQKRVQDVFSRHDFGCNTQAVAEMMEALTGRRPTKKSSSTFPLFTVVGTPDGAVRLTECMVVAVMNGVSYCWPMNGTGKQGYCTTNGNSKRLEGNAALAAIKKFEDELTDEVLVPWIAEKIGTSLLRDTLTALK
jgi:hypothetical protein